MSQFPTSLDSDVDLPIVSDNITEIGGDAINALRSAMFNVEAEIGIGASGSQGSIANRLGVSINADGTIIPSSLIGIGLVALPITDSEISPTAAIQESKLNLQYGTSNLHTLYTNLKTAIDVVNDFISITGVKVEPHIAGSDYRHTLSHLDIAASVGSYFKNRHGSLRDNTNGYTLLNDLNKDLVSHEKADSTNFGSTDPTSGTVGTVPPNNYAHVGAGIFLNTTNFSFIPQTTTDLQQFVEFMDNSNIFLLGTKIQTLFNNGIPRTARSGTLLNGDKGQNIVPLTTATTYLLHSGSTTPVDDIDIGDDLIELKPSAGQLTDNVFDSKFAQVKVGDIITVNYGSIIVPFVIREIKYTITDPEDSNASRKFIVRIDGKNLFETNLAQVTIERPQFNIDKYGVLAAAQAQPASPISSSLASLILGQPRGAIALGRGFSPDNLDSTHYKLWLAEYITGDPTGLVATFSIDVTGNLGVTPGSYTLDSIVESTNKAFRATGINARFIAFSYNGEFGIMLADPYGNASFSIQAGVLGSDSIVSNQNNNVIDLTTGQDALGFGVTGSDSASPAFTAVFSTPAAALFPTKVFVPRTRNNFYINGVERNRLALQPAQVLDNYGDGYWNATVISTNLISSVRLQTTYQVNKNLSTSGLKTGKTIVATTETTITDVNKIKNSNGRFFIEDVEFNLCACDGYDAYTIITVYDAVGSAYGPVATSGELVNFVQPGDRVRLYFTTDSVAFNIENSSDAIAATIFKRHFETYVNQDGYSYTNERARVNISGSNTTINGITLRGNADLSYINIYSVSPKFTGYKFGPINKVNLFINSYNTSTGIFDGYLSKFDGSSFTNLGPNTVGKKGQIVRFYDESLIDYIDFIFELTDSVPSITNENIDIQIYHTLNFDDEVMQVATCQVNDSTKTIKFLRDTRQFGNISEKHLTTSALDYIAAPTKALSENGIIRGFSKTKISTDNTTIYFNGGTAIINGKIVNVNPESVVMPAVVEIDPGETTTITSIIKWFICINDRGELETVFDTDYNPLSTLATTYSSYSVDYNRIPHVNSSGHFYKLKGTYLSNLVTNTIYKNLVPIALVTADSGIISSYHDLRRFTYNGAGGLTTPFVLGKNASFRSFDSLLTWLDEIVNKASSYNISNSDLGTKVIVKGAFNVDVGSYILNYANKVVFEGDNAILTVSAGKQLPIGNNIELRNLRIDYPDRAHARVSNDPFLISASPLTQSCVILNVGIPIGSTDPISYGVTQNVTIKNCNFTGPSAGKWPWISVYSSNGDPSSFGVLDSVYGANTAGRQILKNISITDNTFEVLDNSVDKSAAISIIYDKGSSTNATRTEPLTLINCNISKNICKNDQLILLSSMSDLAVHMSPIIVKNAKIIDNACGAIGFAVDGYAHGSEGGGGDIGSLLINGNTCKFIYSACGRGTVTEFRTINGSTLPVFRFPQSMACNVIITDNTCSWIQIYIDHGYALITTYTSTIHDNTMIGQDKIYLQEYYTVLGNGVISGFTGPVVYIPANFAIKVIGQPPDVVRLNNTVYPY